MSTSLRSIRPALLGILALGALALAPAAQASPTVTVWAPSGADGATLKAEIEGDLAIAEQRFGPACPSGITATWNAFEVAYPTSPGARAWARSYRSECRIDFNASLWADASWRDAIYAPPWLCTLVVHEYGHLTGQEHSGDPANVMYPLIDRVYEGCGGAKAPAAPPPARASTAPKTRQASKASKASARESRLTRRAPARVGRAKHRRPRRRGRA